MDKRQKLEVENMEKARKRGAADFANVSKLKHLATAANMLIIGHYHIDTPGASKSGNWP